MGVAKSAPSPLPRSTNVAGDFVFLQNESEGFVRAIWREMRMIDAYNNKMTTITNVVLIVIQTVLEHHVTWKTSNYGNYVFLIHYSVYDKKITILFLFLGQTSDRGQSVGVHQNTPCESVHYSYPILSWSLFLLWTCQPTVQLRNNARMVSSFQS